VARFAVFAKVQEIALSGESEKLDSERWTSPMRRSRLAVFIAAGLIVASLVFGRFFAYSQTQTKAQRHVIYYVDPMHPSYKSDKPGIAPDCGMQLVPVYEGDAGSDPSAKIVHASAQPLAIDGHAQQLAGIRVAEVHKSGTTRMAHVVGRVTPEDIRTYIVNPGVDGFVRETFNDSVGNFVKKDQKIASFYSPDFLSAASGFLAASERVPGTTNGKDGAKFTPNWGGTIAKEGLRSIQGYTDHLRNLGMSDEQIKRIAETRELPDSIEVVSPSDGIILARNITPGMHFDHAMEFYKIADLSQIWVEAEVNEADALSLRPGSMAQVTLQGGGRKFSARVADSLPQSEAGGDTVKVRLELDNHSFALRPDMIVDVDLPLGAMTAVTVPMDALVYSGDRTRVYVEHGQGKFEAREVQTGSRVGDQVEILHGITSGDRIVVAGTFLVDSENRLKNPAAAPASAPAPMSASTPAHAAVAASSDPAASTPASVMAPDKSAEMHDHTDSMKMSHNQHPM
jgi:Cu(I)/Ag(I) efflux system membrane fusion protein